MITTLLALAILLPGGPVLQGETPEPDPGGWFTVPSGPLPWSLPPLPDPTITLEYPDLVVDPPEHSDAYEAEVSDIEGAIDLMQAPIEALNAITEAFIGNTGALPDMTGEGDFDTGLDPVGAGAMSGYTIAAELAEDIARPFRLIRALMDINIIESTGFLSTIGPYIAFMLIAIAWVALVYVVTLGIQLSDALFSAVSKVLDIIAEVIPL